MITRVQMSTRISSAFMDRRVGVNFNLLETVAVIIVKSKRLDNDSRMRWKVLEAFYRSIQEILQLGFEKFATLTINWNRTGKWERLKFPNTILLQIL